MEYIDTLVNNLPARSCTSMAARAPAGDPSQAARLARPAVRPRVLARDLTGTTRSPGAGTWSKASSRRPLRPPDTRKSMTTNGQSPAGTTIPGTKLARDATELLRESTSNLIHLHSRPVHWCGSPPGHGVPEDSIRRAWTAIAPTATPGIPESGEPGVALVTAVVEPPGRDAFVLRIHLPWPAALRLEMVADDVHNGDPDAAAPALERAGGPTRPDSSLLAALICVALGLLDRHARHRPGDTALACEAEGLPGEASEPAPPPGGPAWRVEPLTQSEARVLRYLPTHMGTPEIAAELYISANTVRTHQRHLYRKLGAHSRHEAVQRARALGLLPGSSAAHRTAAAGRPRAGVTPPV